MEDLSDHTNESPGSLGGGHRVDWCRGNALDLHSAGAEFDLCRDTSYPDSFFMVLFTPSKGNATTASFPILSIHSQIILSFDAIQSGLLILKGGHHDPV
jgi:hypothetical protein